MVTAPATGRQPRRSRVACTEAETERMGITVTVLPWSPDSVAQEISGDGHTAQISPAVSVRVSGYEAALVVEDKGAGESQFGGSD